MAYSNEIVSRAKAQLARMAEDKQSLAQQRLAEVYEKLPRIRQIDLELRRTMVQAAQASFLQGGNTAALDEARAHNQQLQQERQQLLSSAFAPGFLDEAPVCSRCGGTGYIGSSMCRCLADLCRAEQQKALSVLGSGNDDFARFRLDYYSDAYNAQIKSSPRQIMEKTLDYCRRYALRFTPEAGNLLFVGGTGRGKTFLAGCIAKTVSDRGYGVVYESSGKLFSVLESAKFNTNEENLRDAAKYTACDLLILDDLGTEMPGQFVTAALYSLVNERLLNGKATIITTNLTSEEVERRYSPQIASRLYGEYRTLTFVGDDIRVLKNRGKL